MRVIIFLASLFIGTEASISNFDNKCASGEISGWTFFSSDNKHVQLQRSYNITGGLNDSICVKAPFRPIVYRHNNTMEKTFTYRNMSSTHKIGPGAASFWPSAKFLLEFSATETVSTKTRSPVLLNYVNSTFLHAAHGYRLRAPKWKFIYCDNSCAVVEVLSKDGGINGYRKCELWIRVGRKEKIHASAATEPCKSFFQSSCYTPYPTQVYIPSLCD
uniref:Putative salivary lipocalin n=1 Tax=Rhipicephalus pulchellus TaxID=72859 RepID=L7LTC9_RHIPC